MIAPNSIGHLTDVLFRWLRDSHDAAHDLQLQRKDDRGDWYNDTSFGTDRYQYLVQTAKSLRDELDDLLVDRGENSLLLKLPRVAVYPFRVEAGPYKPIRNISDLRKELLSDEPPSDEETRDLHLLTRKEALVNGRELLLLPWTGSERQGCTGIWAGQGILEGSLINWGWIVSLDTAAEGGGTQVHPTPLGPIPTPDVFDGHPPSLPTLRPHPERPHGSGG
ncbi:hypothetical protein [Umezawaea tangerina]|nr:hypothetical protein [Umezawaea tangerina]